MNAKKSHHVELSDKELQLIGSLKDNPEMLEKLISVTNKFNQELSDGIDVYEAECHIVEAIGESGRSMIGNWAEQSQLSAVEKATESPDFVKHGKKTLLVFEPSDK